MPISRADYVQETSTTTGTGTYDLAGAVTGYQGFVAGVGDGALVRYSATDGTDWEVGEGTITDATPDTLSRTTILSSSNAGSAVNWGAGSKTISLVLTADEINDLHVSGFSAVSDGSTQTNCGTAAGLTAITTGYTELYDVNSNFSSGVYQPTIPGLYLIGGTIVGSNIDNGGYFAIYLEHSTDGTTYVNSDNKSGLLNRGGSGANGLSLGGSGSILVEANGTTDRWRLAFFHTISSSACLVPANTSNVSWLRFYAKYIGETS